MEQTPVPVWIHAPVGRDGPLIQRALSGSTDRVRIARDADDIRRASAEGLLGVLVITGEGLTSDVFAAVGDHIRDMPRWAELPIILLVNAAGNTITTLERLQDALPRTKLLVLQRPVRPSAIESAVEIMRLSRLRQYALRDYIERQDVLRRELNHRVKNILATVQAMYGLTVRAADDLDAFDELFQGRLRAMADVHDLLHARSYTGTSLREAITSVLRPYGEDRLSLIDETELVVSAEAAQGMALMAHELATNAAKYGALRDRDGRVTIHISADDDDVRIRWTERGGPPAGEPGTPGYGTAFVTATVRGYNGDVKYDYGRDGLEVDFRLPVASIAPETR